MATTLPKLVSVQLTYAQYAKIATRTWSLPSAVQIDALTDNGDDATVTVRFVGAGLGDFAQTQPVPAHIEVSPANVVAIEAIGSSSSSSSSSGA